MSCIKCMFLSLMIFCGASQLVSNLTCFSLCSFWRQRSLCVRSLGTEEMNSSVNRPSSALVRDRANRSDNDNSEHAGNYGSQYALCALGVGLVALGIVMIVWSVVPPDSSSGSSSFGDADTRKNKASSVAFVLVGSGVAMLLLSLCLGMRNKQREQQRLHEAQNRRGGATNGQDESETWVKIMW